MLAIKNKPVPIYGNGENIRDWLHAADHCNAIDLVVSKGRAGEIYNIGCNNERRNIDVVRLILKEMGKDQSLIEFVKDRPGHDLRYSVDASKITKELGWHPFYKFEWDQGNDYLVHEQPGLDKMTSKPESMATTIILSRTDWFLRYPVSNVDVFRHTPYKPGIPICPGLESKYSIIS